VRDDPLEVQRRAAEQQLHMKQRGPARADTVHAVLALELADNTLGVGHSLAV
jgi:hypothetical protein